MKSFYKNNFLNPTEFDQLSKICKSKEKEFDTSNYAKSYGRYGAFLFLPESLENAITEKARIAFNVPDLKITYVQLSKYIIVDNNLPKLTPHIDKLPCTHIIDLCIDTTIPDWGLLVGDRLFEDKPNGAVFLYGNEEIHSRPEYPSQNTKDYSLQLFLNFAPSDFWFFKGDYQKAIKVMKLIPLMYSESDKNITAIQK